MIARAALRPEKTVSESDTDPSDRARFLEIVGRHTLRMERLVRDLLRLARLEAGQETLERAPSDVKGLVRGVVEDLAPTFAERRQTMSASLLG